MRRRSTETTSSSVSLFPFLAVLICTMGVMIILLVVASRAAEVHQQETNAVFQQECAESRELLDFELQSQELKIHVLLGTRPNLQARLAQARLRRSHVENALRELETKFNESVARAQLLSQNDSDLAEIQEPEIQRLQTQIAAAERELESALQDRAASPTSYAIVTHPSIHGTLRRPIYVECAATTITLQPSGVVIQTSELTPPVLPGNALDTALLATREYWIKYDLAGEHGEPYPLLVVRPDGAQSYAIARQAMQNWNDEFGYELVEQNKHIAFGELDPALANTLQTAIATARVQYAVIRGIAQREAQSQLAEEQGSNGLQVSRNGGFEMIGGPIAVTDRPDSSQQPSKESAAVNASAAGSNLTKTQATADSHSHAQGQTKSELQGLAPLVPLANSRGSNWALPSRNENATAYRRPIVVYCDADALTVGGGQRSENRQEIAFRADAESIDRFVDAIWQVMETWGIAERNGYWKPELQFVVYPAGHPTFERVQTLLDGCGFDVRRVTIR